MCDRNHKPPSEKHTLSRSTSTHASNSTQPQAHQDGIFFRVSIVAWPPTGLAPAQGTVKIERFLVGRTHLQQELASLRRSQLFDKRKKKVSADSAALVCRQNCNCFKFCLRRQKAGDCETRHGAAVRFFRDQRNSAGRRVIVERGNISGSRPLRRI